MFYIGGGGKEVARGLGRAAMLDLLGEVLGKKKHM